MYKAHSKDINRNKSFHPVTFSNLRKVEKLKEKAAEKEQVHNERTNELYHDQEKRRYDELVLNSSLSLGAGVEGRLQGMGLAHSLQVRKVFDAEYKRESESKSIPHHSEEKGPVEQTFNSAYESQAIKSVNRGDFLSKFRQNVGFEGTEAVGTPAKQTEGNQEGHQKLADRKRQRDDEDHSKNEPLSCTGLVTSSEVFRIKKERDLLQKQRLDPKLRVVAYQNKTLSEAARLRNRQSELMQNGKESLKDLEESNNANYTKSKERDAIEERIRSILKMKKS
ncbi:unnamed protein product [Phytomonas sp. Hart1]|nr:unnamed protein product [Phytomonas sp. Hart1]|eukprot:CCW71898.1 unnamed protein product [Phytomonas sp. isolate Hart1]